MASELSSQERIELVIPADDLILPFQAEQADVVGRLVKLGPVVDTILSRHDYPEPVSKLLGEAVALTALLGASLKSEGKFILQASTDGPVDLLVADYQVPGRYVAMRASRPTASPTSAGDSEVSQLLGQGHFAMTIDRGPDTERYQGVVPLEGESLTEAADTYFRQSEQLPTFIRLAVAKHYRAGQADGPGRGEPAACWCRSSPARAGTARAAPASTRKIGRGPVPLPRRSRITSCSIRCFQPTGCSTACSTRSRCAPTVPSTLKPIAAARASGSKSC